MKLYDNPASPFCRKVTVLLHETGQIDEVEIIPAAGHPTAPGTLPLSENPLGKIPTLIRPDAPAMYDSRVICRFLDDRAGAGLYPEHRLWDTLVLEATAEGIMEAAVLSVYERRSRPEATQDEAWIDAQWAKIARALDALNARWMSHLHGRFDMGQVAVGVALGYLDFRLPHRDWRTGRDALAAWEATFRERPSMLATAPKDP